MVAGDSDRLTRLGDVVNTYDYPQVTIKVLEGMGHFAPAEIPAEISQTVRAWLLPEPAPVPVRMQILPVPRTRWI